MTNEDSHAHRRNDFLIGLITGSALGVAAMIFGPRLLSGLRDQVADSARSLGRRAQGVRDDVCDAVAHGAQEIERYATEAKTEHAGSPDTHSADHQSRSARHAAG